MLGAKQEGEPMRHFGKDGATYYRFVWLYGENSQVLDKSNELAGASQASASV